MPATKKHAVVRNPHELVDCVRCGGSGKIEQFSHIERGVCFECGGSGKSRPRRALSPEPPSPVLPHKEIQLFGEPWFIIKTGDHFVAAPKALVGEPREYALNEGHGFRVTPQGRVEMSITLGNRLGWGTPNKKTVYGSSLMNWVLEKSGVGEYERAETGPREWGIWLSFLLKLQAELQQAVRR